MKYVRLAVAVLVVVNAACGSAGMRAPVAATTDDNTIAIRVRTSLQNAPGVHPQEIQVEVTGGVVLLKGDVHGDAEVSAAVGAAKAVAGVRDVKSELKPKSMI